MLQYNSLIESRLRLNIADYLLFFIAFFASWGTGLQTVSTFDLSKLFIIFSIFLIVYWCFFVKNKFIFPKYFNIFFIFAFVHTLIAYTLLFNNEFTFKYLETIVLENGFVTIEEAVGLKIVRFFLFMLLGNALASLIKETRQLRRFTFGYTLGVLSVILLGGYSSYTGSGYRLSGGFLNPNAFGLAGLTVTFFSLINYFYENQKQILKTTFLSFSLLGICIILMSGSRGTMLSLIIGLIVFFANTKTFRTVRIILVIILFSVLSLMLFEERISATLAQRISLLGEDRGAGRMDIWKDYLSEFPKYIFTGAGLHRSIEVIKNSYSVILKTTHNNYLRVLVEFGLLGLLFFIMGIKQIYKRLSRSKSYFSSGIKSLLIAWCVSSLFMDSLDSRTTWIILGITVAYSEILKKEIYRKQNE